MSNPVTELTIGFFGPKPVQIRDEDILTISNNDGRVLFRIDHEGGVEGDLADASEAAAIFCRELEKMMRGLSHPEAVRVAIGPTSP